MKIYVRQRLSLWESSAKGGERAICEITSLRHAYTWHLPQRRRLIIFIEQSNKSVKCQRNKNETDSRFPLSRSRFSPAQQSVSALPVTARMPFAVLMRTSEGQYSSIPVTPEMRICPRSTISRISFGTIGMCGGLQLCGFLLLLMWKSFRFDSRG